MPTRTRRERSPRKKPRQERAQATVEALLQAATYILTRRGWSALTTNASAERAGVNIASLYQYFPNKEAIVAELRRRHLERIESCASCTLLERYLSREDGAAPKPPRRRGSAGRARR